MPPENSFDDQVVRGGRHTDSNSEINLPFGRNIKIRGGEELLLLFPERDHLCDASVIGVVFDPAADLFRKVIAQLRSRRKPQTLMYIWPVPCPLQRRIDSKVPAVDCFVDDGPYLPGPCVQRILRPLIPNFGRNTHADGPVPGIGNTNARTYVVANPLRSVTILLAREDVKPHLHPVREPLRDFRGLVLLMIGRVYAINLIPLTQSSKV